MSSLTRQPISVPRSLSPQDDSSDSEGDTTAHPPPPSYDHAVQKSAPGSFQCFDKECYQTTPHRMTTWAQVVDHMQRVHHQSVSPIQHSTSIIKQENPQDGPKINQKEAGGTVRQHEPVHISPPLSHSSREDQASADKVSQKTESPVSIDLRNGNEISGSFTIYGARITNP